MASPRRATAAAPWRPVIEAFEAAYGTLDRACAVQPGEPDFLVGYGVAEDIQGKLWAAASDSLRAVEQHLASGGELAAAGGDIADPKAWQMLLGPIVESYAEVWEIPGSTDLAVAVAFKAGTNALVRQLRTHRQALKTGAIVLILAGCSHEVSGETGSGVNRLDSAVVVDAIEATTAASTDVPELASDDVDS